MHKERIVTSLRRVGWPGERPLSCNRTRLSVLRPGIDISGETQAWQLTAQICLTCSRLTHAVGRRIPRSGAWCTGSGPPHTRPHSRRWCVARASEESEAPAETVTSAQFICQHTPKGTINFPHHIPWWLVSYCSYEIQYIIFFLSFDRSLCYHLSSFRSLSETKPQL